MSFTHFKPILYIEDLHKIILQSIHSNFRMNMNLKRVNEYAFLVEQKSEINLKKIYLFLLMNEFTQQLYVGTTLSIKETLKKHSDILEGFGNEGEIVLHTLCILHLESRFLDLKKLKKKIEKSLFDIGYVVWSRTETNYKAFKETEIEYLINGISVYDELQDELRYDEVVESIHGPKKSDRGLLNYYKNFEMKYSELEREKNKLIKVLEDILGESDD